MGILLSGFRPTAQTMVAAILNGALFMTLCLQMVLSLKLNVEIRETGSDGIGNSEADFIGVAAKTRFNVTTGLSRFVENVKFVDRFLPGFLDTLTKTKELTIFAPSDVAFDFDPYPNGTLAGPIYQSLLGHIVAKRIPSAAITDIPLRVVTLSGKDITIRKRVRLSMCRLLTEEPMYPKLIYFSAMVLSTLLTIVSITPF